MIWTFLGMAPKTFLFHSRRASLVFLCLVARQQPCLHASWMIYVVFGCSNHIASNRKGLGEGIVSVWYYRVEACGLKNGREVDDSEVGEERLSLDVGKTTIKVLLDVSGSTS